MATSPNRAKLHGEFDYIVVGAGSAGSVVASRLSEDPNVSVLIIEAGSHYNNPLYTMPLLAGRLFEMKQHNWFYHTVPQKRLNNRVLFMPRGKMVGGSFVFNGTQYVRGNRYDYDLWAQLGARGWSYAEVLPYFKRSEAYHGEESVYHGKSGNLTVSKLPVVSEVTKAWLNAAEQAGHRRNEDFNGAAQDGFGTYDFNLRNGKRWTTALAFLYPALERPSLSIVVNALCKRVVISEGRATGVEFLQGQDLKFAKARREVILCGGSINSPQLMQLSGLGDARHLEQLGLPVVRHMPEVGRNMQDHLYVLMGYECLKPVSLIHALRVDRLVIGMLNAFFRGRGQVSRSPLEAGGFFHSKPGLGAPDMQANFVPIMNLDARIWAPWEARGIRDTFAGYVWQNRAESKGTVMLRSPDPREAPVVDPNYLDAENDLITTREGVREARRIIMQPALDAYRGKELPPSAGMNSDNEIDAFIRERAGTNHHSCGTLRMGSDPNSVVDPELRVRGVDGLRVADASVMPTVVTANTNATTIMIGEKASDLIRGRRLQPIEIDMTAIA